MRTIHIYFVTGASKGIGRALYEQLQIDGNIVIGLARTNPNRASRFVEVDLTSSSHLDELLTEQIAEWKEQATSFTLINNAGTVEPIGVMGTIDSDNIDTAYRLNVIAPLLLTNVFIRELKDFEGEKKVLNISSGAGRNAYEGWGVYCSTKAAIDHFSVVVAKEQASSSHPVKIVSIAPGIIDTEMQKTIRNSDEEKFPLHEKFVTYKDQGLLSSAEETAEKLITFMSLADFGQQNVLSDIREVKLD